MVKRAPPWSKIKFPFDLFSAHLKNYWLEQLVALFFPHQMRPILLNFSTSHVDDVIIERRHPGVDSCACAKMRRIMTSL